MFTLLVGEIGFNRREFLYELRQWEINAVIKGYRARARTHWETARLNAYFIMSAQANLRKMGIYRDTDLIKFPWETRVQSGDQPTAADVERIRRQIKEENERLQNQT